METITTKRQNSEVLASDILLAIFVNLKKQCDKKQLFLKVGYYDLQLIINTLLFNCCPYNFDLLSNIFVFSNSGPHPHFSPQLQEAIQQLQLSGLISWPDLQEPKLMRLSPCAESWYNEMLASQRLSSQYATKCQRFAERIREYFSGLVVDRPHLMNC